RFLRHQEERAQFSIRPLSQPPCCTGRRPCKLIPRTAAPTRSPRHRLNPPSRGMITPREGLPLTETSWSRFTQRIPPILRRISERSPLLSRIKAESVATVGPPIFRGGTSEQEKTRPLISRRPELCFRPRFSTFSRTQ